MLQTNPIQSAENLPSDMAEDVEVGSGTSSTTRLIKNSSASRTWLTMLRLLTMVMVVMMKRSKDHLFSKKPNVPTRYLTSLRSDADNIPSKRRWVSPDSFWPLLKLSVKGTVGKAIKQSSRQATQGSHPNFLCENRCFISPTNWALVRSTESMSSLNTTPHQLSSYEFWAPVLLWVAHPLGAWYCCIKGSSTERIAILLSGLKTYLAWRPTKLRIWRCYVVSTPCALEVIRTELGDQRKEERYNSSLVIFGPTHKDGQYL